MLRTAIARSAAEIESLRPAWERLHRTRGRTLFQSFDWNLLAARSFAGREAPYVVHVGSDSGEAIIPACRVAGGQLSFLGEALFDYRDVLSAGDEGVLRRAWAVLAAEQRELSLVALRGKAARRRWEALGFSPGPFCNAPRATAAQTSAATFAARHTQAGRRLRRLGRAGFEVRVHSGKESALVRLVYERKARQQHPENLFADAARVEFAIAAAALDSRCEVFTLESPSSLLAALVTYRDGCMRRFYTAYYDVAWGKFSPGSVLLYEVTRRSLDEGLDCDYMTGEQVHKTRFATSAVPLFRVNATAEQLAEIGRGRQLELVA